MNIKKIALASVAALLLAGCVKPYMLLSAGKPLSSYSNIKVQIDATRFLETKKDDPHYDGYAKSVEDLRNVITSRVNGWLVSDFHGTPGGPVATLTIIIDQFHTGSGVGRFFLGAAANGNLDVSATITGGHEFRAHAEIQGVGTDKLNAYIQVARASERYIADHE